LFNQVVEGLQTLGGLHRLIPDEPVNQLSGLYLELAVTGYARTHQGLAHGPAGRLKKISGSPVHLI
jgi:hypothetical protein